MKNQVLFLVMVVIASVPTRALPITETFSRTLTLEEGLFDGTTFQEVVMSDPGTIRSISDVKVKVTISEGNTSPVQNSDLAATITLDVGGAYALLFDGSSLSAATGASIGMDVVFSDAAAASIGDAIPSGLVPMISGEYKAQDQLGLVFGALDPRGLSWFLNVSDFSALGSGAVLFWEMQVTGEASAETTVPDGGNVAWLGFSAIVLMHRLQRRRESSAAFRDLRQARSLL